MTESQTNESQIHDNGSASKMAVCHVCGAAKPEDEFMFLIVSRTSQRRNVCCLECFIDGTLWAARQAFATRNIEKT